MALGVEKGESSFGKGETQGAGKGDVESGAVAAVIVRRAVTYERRRTR